MVKVLFVCLGNICRSPTGEGVFRHLLKSRRLERHIQVDSAGTSGWHVGEAPDGRACQEAQRRGIDLSGQRSRAVDHNDFDTFDYILAMDTENYRNLRALCPEDKQNRIYRCMDFAPKLGIQDVPDPYYGGDDGFKKVFDMVESACLGLLAEIESKHQ